MRADNKLDNRKRQFNDFRNKFSNTIEFNANHDRSNNY